MQVAREPRALVGDRKPRELGACRVQLPVARAQVRDHEHQHPDAQRRLANPKIAPAAASAANSEPTHRAVHSNTP